MNLSLRAYRWFWCLLTFICGTGVLWPNVAFAQAAAASKSTFVDLDDAAEAGGYEVTAQLTALPVLWSLARQENSDGYYVNIAPDAISFSVQRDGTKVLLAQHKGAFLASKTAPAKVVLQHQANRWNIIWQDRVVLRAEDGQWQDGPVGWKGAAGAVQNARLQPLGTPYFDDDFMRVSEEAAYQQAKPNPHNGMVISSVEVKETIWNTVQGKWKTTGIMENKKAQVAQSINPFAFESEAEGKNLALAGNDFWTDYRVQCAVKPQGADALGLVLYARDAKNYLMFIWKADGQVQLRSVVAGKTLVLDGSTADAFASGQWYELESRMHGGRWRAYIDGRQVLQADTGWFGRGRIGVYSENAAAGKNAAFDDIQVRATKDVLDDFSVAMPGRWKTMAGSWSWQEAATPQGSAVSRAVMGEETWKDYNVASKAFLPEDGSLGLLLNVTDQGYYLFRISGSQAQSPEAGTAQLLLQGKSSKVLAEAKIGARFDNKSTVWNFGQDQGYLQVTSGKEKALLLEAYDETLTAGQPGIMALRGAKAAPRFDAMLVHFARPRKVWAKVPELYVDSRQAKTMGGWSTPKGEWIPVQPTAQTPEKAKETKSTTLWNKGLFWGSGDIAVKIPALKKDQTMTLLLGDARKPDDAKSTFRLELQQLEQELKVTLLQGNSEHPEVLASAKVVISGKLTEKTLQLSRRGSFIIVRLGEDNPHALLVYQMLQSE